MSSSAVQNTLESKQLMRRLETDVAPVVLESGKHAQSNNHRIVFSTTTFPFKDPSPHTESPDLLGIRIDVCLRDGSFTKPYYLLLKRAGENRKALQLHRHTIPVFIPLQQLARKYLPGPQSGDANVALKPWKKRRQDLRKLVQELRRELVAWHLRRDAVAFLQEELGITNNNTGEESQTEPGLAQRDPNSASWKLGISSVSPTSIEARYVRLEWRDGRAGRVKLSNRGLIERAVIIGDEGRDKAIETAIVGGDGRVENLVQRLLNMAT